MEKSPDEKALILLDEDRWIGQLNALYWIILEGKAVVENLDKANEVICEAIEKLRPLAK